MPMDAHRRADPVSLRIVPATQPFSCFDFVDAEFGGLDSVRRCFSLARSHGLQAVTIEDVPATGLIADENAEIPPYAPDHQMKALRRLAFWSVPVEKADDLGAVGTDGLVGYAILKRDCAPCRNYDSWHVFEAVFRKYPHEHNCVPALREYAIRVGGRDLAVPGVLYCQQNTLNKACAHVALRSLLSRRLPAGDIAYSAINASAVKASGLGFQPGRGLGVPQMRRVLTDQGVPFRDMDYEESEKTDPDIREHLPFQKYLYAGIESGAGALLGFRLSGPGVTGTPRHIIPFFGHTFNKDTWVPDADLAYFDVGGGVGYIPSESWTSSFLGHDDNFGPNFCVPRLYVRPDQAEYAVELLHDHFQYSGCYAEAVGLSFLYSLYPHLVGSANGWMQRLAFYIRPKLQRVVLRAVAVETTDYLDQLRNNPDWDGGLEDTAFIERLASMLPDRLWVVEVSLPHLFPANERKVGEIVLNPGVTPDPKKPVDFGYFLLARLPGKYLTLQSVSGSKPHFLEIPSRLASHTPVLRH